MSKTKTVSVILDEETIKKLDVIADSDDRSRSYIIAKIVADNIEKYLPKEQ